VAEARSLVRLISARLGLLRLISRF
jgi:hypothetical protein